MRILTIDELARLDERTALERHFDQLNDRFLLWLIPIAVLNGIPMLTVFGESGTPAAVLLAVGALASPLMVALLRRQRAYDRSPRPILISWIVGQYALIVLPFWNASATVAIASIVPAHFLLFRYRPSQYVALAATFAIPGIALALFLHPDLTPGTVAFIVIMILWSNAALATAGIAISERVASQFLAGWRRVVAREAEETRMRAELAAARQIQLSMLPDAPPRIAWIDLAGDSIPATEVGGDYFGYFPLDANRLAIVVADVAGHGVASGIVLASIKGALHLLQEELDDPARVMGRLDRMVRDAVRWRMLVTMLIAVVDRSTRTMRVVTAGHPPLYHLSSGVLAECGGSALPLGTRLTSHYTAVERSWSEGDLLVAYTDGLLELQDPAGEAYGAERLLAVLRDVSPIADADAVRQSILADVSRFRADALQEDDLTVVVARLT